MTQTASLLTPTHAQQLAASAINAEIVAERGYWSATDPDEWARRDGDMADYQRRLPGLAYPVYRLGHSKPYTMLLRPDRPRPSDNGKTIKYEWPAGKPLCVDILPRYHDSLRDPTIPIWFTEGAKKADALASLGQSIIPASLNGVWGWRHKTADGDSVPLPDFDELALKGREVVLAFDSDQAVNEKVQNALDAFANFLTERGAIVGSVKLPHGQRKLGVDDAIAVGWTFDRLCATIEWQSDTDEAPDTITSLASISSFRALPVTAQLPEALGADACPWLDEYIAFSRRWSPRSYDGFHESCGLWILSTVAARRVMLPLGGEKFTNLYIALCARTSLWAKSTAAKIAIETIRAAGLSHLLAPDDATPQAFIKRLAEQLPSDWSELPASVQHAEKERVAFAGQRGWFFEEFGEKLAAMMRDGSVMADYRGHFRRFDDCPPTYSYSTIGRGMTTVERPYLALLASLTPADLAPFARKGSSLWGDGFFARYAFVTPPAGAERSRARFPDALRQIPESLSNALRTWHEHLGVPDIAIEQRLDDTGKPTGNYNLHVEPTSPQRCTLGVGVFDAYYCYHDALTDLVDTTENTDLDGSYTRFAEKALRIAMLLASFSNGGRIELSHWARAQAIAERWRRSLHYLVDQLGQSEESPERVLEDKITRLFERQDALTAREVGRGLHISTSEAIRMLDQLVKANVLSMETGKRTKRYRLVAATVTSVTVSQVSQAAQTCDTFPESPGSAEELSHNKEECDVYDTVTLVTVPKNVVPALPVDTATSLRLRNAAPDLYASGWRAASDVGGYRLYHPASGQQTGLYTQLEAAARAAELLTQPDAEHVLGGAA